MIAMTPVTVECISKHNDDCYTHSIIDAYPIRYESRDLKKTNIFSWNWSESLTTTTIINLMSREHESKTLLYSFENQPIDLVLKISENDVQQFDDESYIGEGVVGKLNDIVFQVLRYVPMKIIKNCDYVSGFYGEVSFEFDFQNCNYLFVCKVKKLIVVKLFSNNAEQVIFENYKNIDLRKIFNL